jgi:hypothetical protein
MSSSTYWGSWYRQAVYYLVSLVVSASIGLVAELRFGVPRIRAVNMVVGATLGLVFGLPVFVSRLSELQRAYRIALKFNLPAVGQISKERRKVRNREWYELQLNGFLEFRGSFFQRNSLNYRILRMAFEGRWRTPVTINKLVSSVLEIDAGYDWDVRDWICQAWSKLSQKSIADSIGFDPQKVALTAVLLKVLILTDKLEALESREEMTNIAKDLHHAVD